MRTRDEEVRGRFDPRHRTAAFPGQSLDVALVFPGPLSLVVAWEARGLADAAVAADARWEP